MSNILELHEDESIFDHIVKELMINKEVIADIVPKRYKNSYDKIRFYIEQHVLNEYLEGMGPSIIEGIIKIFNNNRAAGIKLFDEYYILGCIIENHTEDL